ncbi:hypothetical protein AFK68_25610 [Hydrocoleum sp. CS-953]|uniref:TolB family protein n=1 Tax=Hydrocoleum sp. CS-953 TaxID=1671698 RepID=UPI000B9BBEB6|nr:hypothetical protein [Hydrocoleum sp. CS-953]OZH52254.1 hypothetical protein AFK68_25610 [Hydrocoleum sp. CS-953]
MVNFSQKINHLFREAQDIILQELRQPLDRVAISLIIGLTLLICVLFLGAGNTAPKVRDFSWQDKKIGAEDTAFILNFNRPMNHATVEKNLKIEPPLPGKVSWAGRRMAYTILEPAPYGNQYTVKLSEAKERFYGLDQGEVMQPFQSSFQSRDRAFAYIGFQGQEKGRLVLINLTIEQQPILITPQNLEVLEFKFFPEGKKILFSAVERQNEVTSLLEQKIYTVTTGVNSQSPTEKQDAREPVGKIEKVLDNSKYQNLKFDLSPDGKIIIIQRVNRKDVSDAGPWVLELGKEARQLTNKDGIIQKGGDFLITPDSKSLVILQGKGTSILAINPETDSGDLIFLPKFGTVLSFAPDGSMATMVKYNQDGTRSLYIVTNQGEEREILRTRPYGNILSAEFDQNKTILYCLLTQVVEDTTQYQEKPYIAAFDIKRNFLRPLVILPNQREIHLDLSPDGLALLFDQMVTISNKEESEENTETNRQISRLWMLPLDSKMPEDDSPWKLQPEELPLTGFNPKWAP